MREYWQSHGPDNCLPVLPGDQVAQKQCPKDASEAHLAEQMGSQWAAFAAGHAPWAPFTPRRREGSEWLMPQTQTMRLRTVAHGGCALLAGFKADDCAFWARVDANHASI